MLAGCSTVEVSDFDSCVKAGNPVMESFPRQCRDGDNLFVEEIEPIVGGDEDEHGCKGSAGYTWCEEKQKCLRTWEEACESAETKLSPEECSNLGGHSVAGRCGGTEKNIGIVTGFNIPNYCCVKSPVAEGFCGSSTLSQCNRDSDCKTGGCSAQICQSKDEEPIASTCEYRDCYNAKAFNQSCKCIEESCQWGPI